MANGQARTTPDIPTTFWQYLRSFGPGFVVVLTWLGSGDIISAGISGGNYGYALMWAMVVAILMRFFFVTTIAKYQLCNQHGEHLLDGLARLHRWYLPLLLAVIVILGHIQSTYMLVGVSEISVELTGVDATWLWAFMWIIVSLFLILKPIYSHIEWVFKVFIIILSLSLVGTAIWVGPDVIEILKGTLAFKLPDQKGPFSAIIVTMGMIGAVGGSLMNLVYPYFLEQKGWTGPKYRRVQTYDFVLAIVVMIIFNLAVWTLGAELVHTSGKSIETLDDLTLLLSIVLGPYGRYLFLIGVFAAVYTSLLGHGLGLGYLASHVYLKWRSGKSDSTKNYRSHPMYKLIAVWIIASPIVWILAGNVDFISLTLLANALVALLIPALAGGLWWITASAKYIGPEYQNRWWENLLMGLIFALSLWVTLQSAQSVLRMIGDML
jgi:Mn2+/Fe2+ NRAMP family transporter